MELERLASAYQDERRLRMSTREVAAAEGISGGFGAVYDVLKALEDAGRVRRGYFVGVGATQFALPPALELLRSLREIPDDPETLVIAATDTANPYGTTLKWPAFPKATARSGSPCRIIAASTNERRIGFEFRFINQTCERMITKAGGLRPFLKHQA